MIEISNLIQNEIYCCSQNALPLRQLKTLDGWSEFYSKIYFIIDAAIPIDAIDGTAGSNTNMIPPGWLAYSNKVWASEWFNLWTNTDYRSQLTWSNRLANFNGAQVYNFYSSGEEVLRTHVGAPPSLLGLAFSAIAADFWNNSPAEYFVWALQEKEKGRMSSDAILGSFHGGWGYNPTYGTLSSPPSSSVVNALTSSQLQTNPVFNTNYDFQLFTGTASTYAQLYQIPILSDAIPALNIAVG